MARTHRPCASAGDRVTVRGERWVVQEATAFADCTLLDLSSAGVPRRTASLQAARPVRPPCRAERSPGIRAVDPAALDASPARAPLRGARVHGELRAPQRAAIDILPFQLEPALALIRGHASRFLLADEVGLGKTIQAGLMLAELRQRGWCERALIITPAGLRQQWADELRHRFDIRPRRHGCRIAGGARRFAALRRQSRGPSSRSPSRRSISSSSPKCLRGLAAQLWDLADRRRSASGADRLPAVRRRSDALATRARHVCSSPPRLMPATISAYRALCATWDECRRRPDRRLLLFRRTREQAGLPRSRRAHLLPVRPTPMASRCIGCSTAIWRSSGDRARVGAGSDVQLVAMVLAKRAFSSARSLARRSNGGWPGSPARSTRPRRRAPCRSTTNDDSDERAASDTRPPSTVTRTSGRSFGASSSCARCAQTRRAEDARAPAHPPARGTNRSSSSPSTATRSMPSAARSAALRRLTTLHGGQTAHERRQSHRGLHERRSRRDDRHRRRLRRSEPSRHLPACRQSRAARGTRFASNSASAGSIASARRARCTPSTCLPTAPQNATVLARSAAADRSDPNERDRDRRVRHHPIGTALDEPRRHPHTNAVDLGEAAKVAAQRIAEARTVGTARAVRMENVVPVTVLRRRPDGNPCERRPCLIAFFRVRLADNRRPADRRQTAARPPANSTCLSRRLARREIRATGRSVLATVQRDLVPLRHANMRIGEDSAISRRIAAGAIARDRARAPDRHGARRPAQPAGAGRALRLASIEAEAGGRNIATPYGTTAIVAQPSSRPIRVSFSRRTRELAHRFSPMLAWAERLARIAPLRRANSPRRNSAGRLGEASLSAAAERSFTALVAGQASQLGPGVEHPIDLGHGRRAARRAPWLSVRHELGDGPATHGTRC